jgi:hypothetical protein
VRGLPPGVHGIHIHAVGRCAPDFSAAGSHYNPAGKKHGLENPEGAHAGDLPNLTIGQDGTGTFDTTTSMVSLTPGDKTVFDADGSAIVIHAFQDDQKTDPTGNSGERIACAIIQMVAAEQPAQPGQPGTQPLPSAGGPAQLPATGGGDMPLFAFVLAALLLVGGALALRGARAKG